MALRDYFRKAINAAREWNEIISIPNNHKMCRECENKVGCEFYTEKGSAIKGCGCYLLHFNKS